MAALTTVYIVRTAISSPSQIESRREIDDQTTEMTLSFDKETRAKITTARNQCGNALARLSVPFYGLKVAKQDALPEIEKLVQKADSDLRAINEQLRAEVKFIPVGVDQKARGELYLAMSQAIRGHILKILNERLAKLAKMESVPSRSRIAICELVDRMQAWNVLEDPDINKTLTEFKTQFEHDIIGPVAAEIERELATTTNAGAFVEF